MTGAPAENTSSTPAPLALGAFAWGLAEATLFFIVPDVLISFEGLRSARRATTATLWALAGALVGGAVMWWFGEHHSEATLALLAHIPGITGSTVRAVGERTGEAGLAAVLSGPVRGVPYKIYAAQWGTARGALGPFLLASVVARVPRFLLIGYAARGVARLTRRADVLSGRALQVAIGVLWVAFYVYYLSAIAPVASP